MIGDSGTSAAEYHQPNRRGDITHIWMELKNTGWMRIWDGAIPMLRRPFRDIYRYVTYVKDPGGNWSVNEPVIPHWSNLTGGNADRSTNYWLGDFATADAGGMSGSRGYVDMEDLSVLSTSYFKRVGSGATDYCNIGPILTENGSVGKSIPNPDYPNGYVNFYDLVPFSFNYNMVSPVDSVKEFLIMPDPNTITNFGTLDAAPVVSYHPHNRNTDSGRFFVQCLCCIKWK